MRLLRSLVVLVLLSLLLGASVASAAEAPPTPAGREASFLSRILGNLGAFLISIWANEAGQIDPWGGSTPSSGTTPSSDEGWHIDPWG